MMVTPAPTITSTVSAASPSPVQTQGRTEAIRESAVAFEAAFLAEMLSHTGLGATPSGFGGGAGEDAFGSLLTREWAELIARDGGVGVAEWVVTALSRGEDGDV